MNQQDNLQTILRKKRNDNTGKKFPGQVRSKKTFLNDVIREGLDNYMEGKISRSALGRKLGKSVGQMNTLHQIYVEEQLGKFRDGGIENTPIEIPMKIDTICTEGMPYFQIQDAINEQLKREKQVRVSEAILHQDTICPNLFLNSRLVTKARYYPNDGY